MYIYLYLLVYSILSLYFSKNYIIQFIHLFTIRQQNQARVHSKNLESYNFFKGFLLIISFEARVMHVTTLIKKGS